MDLVSLTLFILAVIHTFLVKKIHHFALTFPTNSISRKLFLFFAELEFIFAIWSIVLLLSMYFLVGPISTIAYIEKLSFTEPLFVFSILVICSSEPILEFCKIIILSLARLIPLSKNMTSFFILMTLSPLLGSLISEPAAMTVTSLLLFDFLKNQKVTLAFKYSLLGLLFVNISIGGILTPFAAPPIIMVAKTWNWDLIFTLKQFGIKSILAIIIATLYVLFKNKNSLKSLNLVEVATLKTQLKPRFFANIFLHLLILSLVIIYSDDALKFSFFFFIFLALHLFILKTYKSLKLKEGLYVAVFLMGLIFIGPQQKWWIEKIITHISPHLLYFTSIVLTSFTDNAALTFLGSQVSDLSDSAKYFLVAGSVVGGGLTVIANAPNPIGYSILVPLFEKDGISPLKLFMNALIPTFIALFCFLIFP